MNVHGCEDMKVALRFLIVSSTARMSQREEFLRKMGLTADDLRPPAVAAATLARPVVKGEPFIDDSFIRSATLTDAEALKNSPHNVAARTKESQEALTAFRTARNATLSRELGLEGGASHHDALAAEGKRGQVPPGVQARFSTAKGYKEHLFSEYRKKKASGDVEL